MARPRVASDLTDDEAAEIRRLYLEGIRITEIVERTGRGASTVQKATRDLSRKRPPPPSGKHAKRNDRILELAAKGWSRERIGEAFDLSPSQVSTVIARHPHVAYLPTVRRLKPATVARRYRLELSTCERIAAGKPRTWKRTRTYWTE